MELKQEKPLDNAASNYFDNSLGKLGESIQSNEISVKRIMTKDGQSTTISIIQG